CMYAPPHEFGVDLPEALAEARVESYRAFGWPAILSRTMAMGTRGAIVVSAAAALATLGLVLALGPPRRVVEAHLGPGAFYQVVPYAAMLTAFLLLAAYAGVAMAVSGLRFWRRAGARPADVLDPGAALTAARQALGLEYLRGGGDGCYYPADRPSGT